MSSYNLLCGSTNDFSDEIFCCKHEHGKFHKVLKYWRNSPKIPPLKKSVSFTDAQKLKKVGEVTLRSSRNYQRLESVDETKLRKMR